MTPPLWWKVNKKVKEESEKDGLKLNIQKTKIMASGPITSWQRWGNSGISDRLYLGISPLFPAAAARCTRLGQSAGCRQSSQRAGRVDLAPGDRLLAPFFTSRVFTATARPPKRPRLLVLALASLVAQTVKSLPAMRETQVRSLGGEDPLEKEMATHSSTLAWEISRMEKPGGLQSMGS